MLTPQLSVSLLLVGILVLIYIYITIEVIRARRKLRISVGNGPNNEIIHIVSGHNNFANYAIIFTIIVLLLEINQAVPKVFLALLSIAFLIGRVAHFVAFRTSRMNFTLRAIGMHLTLWPLTIGALLSLYSGMRSFI